MFRADKQPAVTDSRETTPGAKAPDEGGKASPPAGGQKKKPGKKDADFTPRTVFGDVAL